MLLRFRGTPRGPRRYVPRSRRSQRLLEAISRDETDQLSPKARVEWRWSRQSFSFGRVATTRAPVAVRSRTEPTRDTRLRLCRSDPARDAPRPAGTVRDPQLKCSWLLRIVPSPAALPATPSA